MQLVSIVVLNNSHQVEAQSLTLNQHLFDDIFT